MYRFLHHLGGWRKRKDLVKKRSKVPEYLIGKVKLTYKDCINDVNTKLAEAGWSKTSDAVNKGSVLSQSCIML
jgi:hypothetical protein